MTNVNVDRARQQAIVGRHTPRIDSLLHKYTGRSRAEVVSQDPVLVSSQYFLRATADKKRFPFLPPVECSISSHYVVMVSPQYLQRGQKMREEQEGTRMYLQVKGRPVYTEVLFPSLSDLFFLRNLAAEGHLLRLPQVRGDPVELPIAEDDIKTGFIFQAKVPFYGEIFAKMPTMHHQAEVIVERFWQTLDDRCLHYYGLESCFREIDRRGQLLGDNDQSYHYKIQRWNLNRVLYNALERVLQEAGLHCVSRRQ